MRSGVRLNRFSRTGEPFCWRLGSELLRTGLLWPLPRHGSDRSRPVAVIPATGCHGLPGPHFIAGGRCMEIGGGGGCLQQVGGWVYTHTPLIGISSTCETVQTSSFGGRVLCLGSVLFLKYYTCTIQKPSDILRNTSPLNQLGSTLVAFHARDRRRRPSTNTMRMLEYLGHIQSPDAAVASC